MLWGERGMQEGTEAKTMDGERQRKHTVSRAAAASTTAENPASAGVERSVAARRFMASSTTRGHSGLASDPRLDETGNRGAAP